ncbi:hypothetical protein [Agrobacterium tumefaciens]|uniref:hypothetical protein n=1 Tax=Agrobacterium tumefaciens TaxID=358 RepID=UPI00287D224C|nr:hypothetical protein [Agrobacterium tumefaciens]MDS7597440.1 hypothetical protein [Agrobacterium tumefaciens]
MKKLIWWTAGGLGLATACGLAGLHHLSASVVTLTAFCSVQGGIIMALDTLSRIRASS